MAWERELKFLRRREGVNHLLAALLGANPAGLYVAIDEVGGRVRALAARTPGRQLLLALSDSRSATERLARTVAAAIPDLTGAQGPEPTVGWFAAAWCRLRGSPVSRGRRLRIYELETVHPPRWAAGHMTPALASDRPLLAKWLTAFQDEADPAELMDGAARERLIAANVSSGYLYLWRDGGPVAMAARLPAGPRRGRVNMVFTPVHLRGRGYASSLVAAVSQAGLDAGLSRLYLYADASNPVANSIYAKLGYSALVDVSEYRLGLHSG